MNTNSDIIHLHGRPFRRHLDRVAIANAVQRLAQQIDLDHAGQDLLLCPVLTGSYIFAADLSRALQTTHEVRFVQYTSYEGMASTGTVHARLPFDEHCRGRHVVIVEDIVESGLCMSVMLEQLAQFDPASVSVCAMLFKPNLFKQSFKVDYIGFTIPDDFIVGYGLDYDGAGRHYPDLYILDESNGTD